MKLYIAGPMTGLPDYNYPAFNKVARFLRRRGHMVENPAENDEPDIPTWDNWLRQALSQMLTCEAIVMIPGWERSKGANFERDVAMRIGMPVYYDHKML